jgi:hypothetical protein
MDEDRASCALNNAATMAGFELVQFPIDYGAALHSVMRRRDRQWWTVTDLFLPNGVDINAV